MAYTNQKTPGYGFANAASGMIQGGTKNQCEPAPEPPTVRQRLTDMAAHFKGEMDKHDRLLKTLPEEVLNMKLRDLSTIIHGVY